MRGEVYRFMEEKQALTEEYRSLLLPLLSLRFPENPWSSQSLRALTQEPEAQDPVLQKALEHLLRYEVPLLEEEERLLAQGLSQEALRDALAQLEEAFWEARLAEEGGWQDPGPYLCPEHRLTLEAVRRIAAQNPTWNSATLVQASGGNPQCSTCRVEAARIMKEVLRAEKAPGMLPEPPSRVSPLPTRTATLRLQDLVQAAQLLAERAEGEGYRVVAAHPVSAWADSPSRAALLLELEAPKLTALLLEEHLEGLLGWPLRLLLWQEAPGAPVRLLAPDPQAYPAWLFPNPPKGEARRHLDWLEVTLDILLRAFA